MSRLRFECLQLGLLPEAVLCILTLEEKQDVLETFKPNHPVGSDADIGVVHGILLHCHPSSFTVSPTSTRVSSARSTPIQYAPPTFQP